MGRADEGDRQRPDPLPPPERARHPGGRPAGGDAEDDVPRRHPGHLHVFGSLGLVVLRPLDGIHEGLAPARDESRHEAGLHAERGRQLGGVEDAEPPARARPGVDPLPAGVEASGDGVDGVGDLRQRPSDGADRLEVGLVDRRDVRERVDHRASSERARRIAPISGM